MAKQIKKYGKKALIFALIILLVGMYVMIPIGQAADLTKETDILSDSRPAVDSNHEIMAVTPTLINEDDTIVIKFDDANNGFVLTDVTDTDVDLAIDDDNGCDGSWTEQETAAGASATEWGISIDTGTDEITLTAPSGVQTWISANICFQVEIGTNATYDGTGEDMITNPAVNGCAGSSNICDIDIVIGSDSGLTKVAIIAGVTVTATVAESLSFSISNVASSQSVNGATTNVATVSGDAVTFGTIAVGTNKIAAHDLVVGTNAAGGYTVTVKYTQKLQISGGNDIDDLSAANDDPAVFPASTEGFGYTTEDSTLGTGTAARFTDTGNEWAKYTTSPLEVVYSSGPASETTRVGYQAGIEADTPAGDHSTVIIYVATPIFN